MDSSLGAFIDHARQKGMDHATIRMLLLSAGWKEKEIARALTAQALDIPVPTPPDVGGAREAFLHLVAFAALYTAVIAGVMLLFDFINVLLPDPAMTQYGSVQAKWVGTAIRWEISALIVSFPLLIWLSWALVREMRATPDKARSPVRRWLTASVRRDHGVGGGRRRRCGWHGRYRFAGGGAAAEVRRSPDRGHPDDPRRGDEPDGGHRLAQPAGDAGDENAAARLVGRGGATRGAPAAADERPRDWRAIRLRGDGHVGLQGVRQLRHGARGGRRHRLEPPRRPPLLRVRRAQPDAVTRQGSRMEDIRRG